VLTEEYSEHGVHVANAVIDGTIDSPGTRAMPRLQNRPDLIINPVKIAEAFYYLHTQDNSFWTHELQLTPFSSKPSYGSTDPLVGVPERQLVSSGLILIAGWQESGGSVVST
jgi:hypothetical protein